MSKLKTASFSTSDLPYGIEAKPKLRRSLTVTDVKVKKSKSKLISPNSQIISDPIDGIPVTDRLQGDIIMQEIKGAIGNDLPSTKNTKLRKISSLVNIGAIEDVNAFIKLEDYLQYNENKKKLWLERSGALQKVTVSQSGSFDFSSFIKRDEEFIAARKSRSSDWTAEEDKNDAEIQPAPEDFIQRNEELLAKKAKYTENDDIDINEPVPVKYERGYKITRERKSIFDVAGTKEEIEVEAALATITTRSIDEEENEEDPEEKERWRQRTNKLASRCIKRLIEKEKEEPEEKEEEEEVVKSSPKKKSYMPSYLKFYTDAKKEYSKKYKSEMIRI